MKGNILENKANKLFLILAGFFITNALVAEFIGVKIFQLETTFGFKPYKWKLLGIDLTFQYSAGVLLWPIVFIMTDIINEYFGKKGVRFLSYGVVVLLIYSFLMIYGAIWLTPADWWKISATEQNVIDLQAAFKKIFGQGLLIIIGSITAFLIGQLIDVLVFHKIKRFTGEGKVYIRATGSTIISQFIDSFIVVGIAFYWGPKLLNQQAWSLNQFLAVATNGYIYKVLMAVLLTPAIYLAHYIIDKYLGLETAKKLKEKAAK